MSAYYNEIDPYAAEWLRNLIKAGHIAPGFVDERSIEDVTPDDLREFTQCHFFAGVGVWSYALRRAGWPDDRPVWTGSCPCQPFSTAGKGDGFADERHLWPAFHYLIEQCRPAIVFGEQVASKDAEAWIDLVQDDLEAMDYAFGAVPFPAAGIGAPHIRDRLYWVADALRSRQPRPRQLGQPSDSTTSADREVDRTVDVRGDSGVGHAADQPRERLAGSLLAAQTQCGGEGVEHGHSLVRPEYASAGVGERPGPTNGQWRDADWLLCRDGKWRPVEPGTFPLAHGAPARVGRLRAYGNAIVAQAAEEFVRAYLD